MNLVNAAVSLAVANSVTRNVAGVNLRDFLFAGTQFSDLHESGWNYINSAADGRNNYNSIITLSEIFRNSQGGAGRSKPFTQMTENLKANWLPLTVGVIGIPMAAKVATKLPAGIFIPAGFTIAKKLLGKSILRPARKMIKATGLEVTV